MPKRGVVGDPETLAGSLSTLPRRPFLAVGRNNVRDGLCWQNVLNEALATVHFRKVGAQFVKCLEHGTASYVVLAIGRKRAAMLVSASPKPANEYLECRILPVSPSTPSVGVLVCHIGAGER
jgi:hypothetical protein